MTQDFLLDFTNCLEREKYQYVIALIDKDNKDFHIIYDVKDEPTFEHVIDILSDIQEGDIG